MLAGVAALVAAALAFYRHGPLWVDEAVELIAQGGDRRLHSPMRSLTAGPRVLLLALDGVGADELYGAIGSGAMPRLAALLGAEIGDGTYAHGYAAPDALSILPSTTMAAWASIYTGQPPAETGVPGNEWFVREEMTFYAPVPVSVQGSAHTLKTLTDGLVGNALRTPTLFELADVRAHVSLAQVYRGADVFTSPEPVIIADLFAALAQGIVGDHTVSQEVYEQIDEESVDTLLERIDALGVPNLQVVYFPGIDLFSHVSADPLAVQPSYLREVLDPAIGRIFDRYATAGVLGDTFVVLVADHGHTPVLNRDRNSLGVDGEDEPTAVLRQAGFRLRPFLLDVANAPPDYQATVAYQGAIAYVYLADRSTCSEPGQTCDWRRPPRFEEDVMPVVRAFHQAHESGALVPALRGALDLIFSRQPRSVDENALPWQIWDGVSLVAIRDYLAGTPRPDLIELESRMDGLGSGPYGHRSGDVLLLARSGMAHPIGQRFYFSKPYRSWHGSPTRQDSHVPLLLARADGDGGRLRALLESVVAGRRPTQLDVVPLVRRLLGAKLDADPNRADQAPTP